jgi:hypothetical protein
LRVLQTAFTIAIPTHNRRETLLLALSTALEQTRPAAQVLVLCDGCTDGSAEAARGIGDPRVEVLELPKLGGYGYAHRDLAIERACGEAVMWLGDDDLLLPDHLERAGELWDTGSVDLVQTPAVLVADDDTLQWLGLDWSVPGHRSTLERHNTNALSSVSVRASLVRQAGGWDGTLSRLGDWDLWKRVLACGARTAMTNEPTVLNFRATGRQQPWLERVAQNRRWHARLLDPAALAALRPQLRRVRSAREEHWRQESHQSAAELKLAYEQLELTSAIGQAVADELAETNVRLADTDAQLASAREQLRSLQAALAEREAELGRERRAGAQRALEVARLQEAEHTLEAIYHGGWWRLRARLLPVLSLATRARAALAPRGVRR